MVGSALICVAGFALVQGARFAVFGVGITLIGFFFQLLRIILHAKGRQHLPQQGGIFTLIHSRALEFSELGANGGFELRSPQIHTLTGVGRR